MMENTNHKLFANCENCARRKTAEQFGADFCELKHYWRIDLPFNPIIDKTTVNLLEAASKAEDENRESESLALYQKAFLRYKSLEGINDSERRALLFGGT